MVRVGHKPLLRYLTVVFAAALLAGGLLLNPVAAKPVGACGWFIPEHNGPVGAVQVWDGRVGGWTRLEFQIITYSDGCGNRFYRLYEWDTTGTIAALQLDLRVWVCGAYQGKFIATVWSNSAFLQSSTYSYWPWCGRQADDFGSAISSGWFSPGFGAAYVTSG